MAKIKKPDAPAVNREAEEWGPQPVNADSEKART
jgi:hypothetical protein